MVKPIDSRLPAVFNSLRTNKTIVVALAVAALGFLLIRVIKSLVGRVKTLTVKELQVQGCSNFNHNEFDQAIEKFTLALQRNPSQNEQSELYTNRAMAYIKKDNSDAALADFEKALNCCPAPDLLLKIYFYRGDLFACQKKNFKAAIADFTAALQLPCTDQKFYAQILIERGRAYRNNREPDAALVDFKNALNCRPAPDLLLNLYFYRGSVFADQKGGVIKSGA